MHQVIYAMRFTGKTETVDAEGTVLRAATSARSTILTATVGPDGMGVGAPGFPEVAPAAGAPTA